MEHGKTIEEYRQELRRTAWRIRYRERVRGAKERSWSEWGEENGAAGNGPYEEERRLREYLELIPFDNGKRVIEALFLKGETEAGAAAELRISQQGVNKWKRKSLDHLRSTLETMNS